MATKKKPEAKGDGHHVRAMPKRNETSRRIADAELKLSLERYQAIVENQVEFVGRHLAGGILTYANASLANFAGMPPEDLAGRSFHDFLHTDDRRELTEKLGALSTALPTVRAENRVTLPDGTTRWHQWSHRAFFDENGKVREYQSVGRDITDQKRAETALRVSESRFRELFETSRDGIVITDLAGRFLECNQAYLDLLGYDTVDQLRLKSYQEVTPREYHAFEAEVIASLTLTRGWSDEYEKEYLRKTGERIAVSLRAWLRRGPEGQPSGMWAIVRDITARKKIEDLQRFLVECGTKGEDFFPALAQYLAGSLGMDYVCIDRLEGDLMTARTVAVYFDGVFEDNVSYTLHDTPCGEVVGKDVCCFADGVRQRFPRDAVLQDMTAESYVGVTLWSHTHQAIGLIAVIGRRPLGDKDLAESVLKLAAIRAASELERKLAENKLLHSKNLMQYVISHAQSAIAVHDRDMNYIYVSDQYLRQYNVKEKDVLGKHHYDVFPNLPQKWRDVHQRVLAGAVEGRDEDPYVREDGLEEWTRWDCRPWYEADGSIGGLIVYTEVITERKRREEARRESERFIRTILDTVDEGFLVIDRDYRILTANKAYCSQLSRADDEVIGQHCHEISHGSLRPCHENGEKCAVREVFVTGTPHTSLHKHQRPDGEMIHVETKAYPIRDASGGVVSAIVTISNVTEKHLLEEERLKTQKLESIGTLAGGIAHDFNNLLQGVFGYIAMARLNFDQRERSLAMLEQAEKALHLSVNLTTQLLTFSKGGKPVKKRIALPPLIEDSVKFALSGSRAEYQITSEPGLRQVEADEGQLGQVFQNIVLNADQAMPLGGSVAISARNLPASREARPPFLDEKDYVLIAIQDSGVGIPAQYLDKIFDPYFTTKEKGSGLGLATSYSIIRNHGGVIDAVSELGKGSTFLIYLPALATVLEAPRQDAVCAGTRTGRILVMDDEELVRNLAGDMLKALGHTPDFADKGETALAVYRSALAAGRPFDAVILDLTIRGGMGGEETMKKLLEIDPGVKAVVSSGYSDDATQSNYRQQGFKAALNKPYRMEDLKRTLDALLG